MLNNQRVNDQVLNVNVCQSYDTSVTDMDGCTSEGEACGKQTCKKRGARGALKKTEFKIQEDSMREFFTLLACSVHVFP